MHCLCVNNRIPIYTLKNYWSIQTAGALVNFYMPPVMLARSGELVVCLLILQISIHITVDLSTSNDIIMVPMPMQIHQHSLIQCPHNLIHLQGNLAEYVFIGIILSLLRVLYTSNSVEYIFKPNNDGILNMQR